MRMSIIGEGLLAPGQLSAWTEEKRKQIAQGIARGLKQARPRTDQILREETRKAFKVASPRMEKAWRIRLIDGETPAPKLEITNLAKWFKIHTTGGSFGPRSQRAMLVPINTRFGSRIGTKKFYQLVAWLMREKLTLIKNGILYVKPPMNTSKRGGVGVGTRVSKKFRAKFQGSLKRPSGFDIKLNEHGLTPIAVLRSKISLTKRFDFEGIVRSRVLPVLANNIQANLTADQVRRAA